MAATAVKPPLLKVSFGGGRPDTFEAVTALDPTVPELAEYAEAYVSKEIDSFYRISVLDASRKMILPHQPFPSPKIPSQLRRTDLY